MIKPTLDRDGQLVAVDGTPPEQQKPEPVAQALALDTPREPPKGCEFSAWLFGQQDRPDPIGQLAYVIARDPLWEGAKRREDAVAHTRRLGARPEVVRLTGQAWDEWERRGATDRKRRQAAARRAAQKAMRKKHRR